MTGGGAERVAAYLLGNLRSEYEVHLLLFTDDIDYELPADQIISFLDKKNGQTNDVVNILRIPIISHRLVKYCREHDIELVLSLLARSNFVACFAKKLGLKAKVLISERIFTPMWYRENTLRGKAGSMLTSGLYKLADAILPNSQGTIDALRDHYGIQNKYFLVKNPIDLNYIGSKLSEIVDDVQFDKFTFVCLAGFRPQKNHRMLIDAFAALENTICQLLLIGKGSLLEEIKKQTVSMGLTDRVLFLGHKDNPFMYLGSADCCILASDFEGFPNVLVEALACGVPVISTDCLTGPRELLSPAARFHAQLTNTIEYGDYGVLVPVGNSKLMTAAMDEMVKNEELRNKYISRGPQKASEYDHEIVMGEFKQIIDAHLSST